MVEIIICDDDKFMAEFSEKLANKALEEFSLNGKVVCVTRELNELLLFLNKNPGDYLYFLDLDFGKNNLNGVDIAKVVKNKAPLSKIVFVTSHGDLGMQVLKSGAEAFGFIEKTLNTDKMLMNYKKYISLALDMTKKPEDENNNNDKDDETKEKSIQLPIGIDEFIDLPLSRILYVETVQNKSHFICYHTTDGSAISVRNTIKDALDELGDDFMKSCRSIIINKKYVVAVEDGFVKFAGGQKVQCAFRMKSEIINECLN